MLGMVSQDDGIGWMSVTENLDSKIKAQEEKLKQLKAQRQAALARERAKEKEQARCQRHLKIDHFMAQSAVEFWPPPT